MSLAREDDMANSQPMLPVYLIRRIIVTAVMTHRPLITRLFRRSHDRVLTQDLATVASNVLELSLVRREFRRELEQALTTSTDQLQRIVNNQSSLIIALEKQSRDLDVDDAETEADIKSKSYWIAAVTRLLGFYKGLRTSLSRYRTGWNDLPYELKTQVFQNLYIGPDCDQLLGWLIQLRSCYFDAAHQTARACYSCRLHAWVLGPDWSMHFRAYYPKSVGDGVPCRLLAMVDRTDLLAAARFRHRLSEKHFRDLRREIHFLSLVSKGFAFDVRRTLVGIAKRLERRQGSLERCISRASSERVDCQSRDRNAGIHYENGYYINKFAQPDVKLWLRQIRQIRQELRGIIRRIDGWARHKDDENLALSLGRLKISVSSPATQL